MVRICGASAGALLIESLKIVSYCLYLNTIVLGKGRNVFIDCIVHRIHEKSSFFTDEIHTSQTFGSLLYFIVYIWNAPLCLLTMYPLFLASQKYFYRFSKSRGKADYFEGRDDSGVVSARFIAEPGGTPEYRHFYLGNSTTTTNEEPQEEAIPEADVPAYTRLLEHCFAMGDPMRPRFDDASSSTWNEWYPHANRAGTRDRCRILLAINTVGAGQGTTMLWETRPPLPYAELPPPWTSEQESAVTHLQRNLEEINALCATGLIAAKVQILVCEPIPAQWTEWMDSLLPACGGKPMDPSAQTAADAALEDRPSPLQIVVTATVDTADTCHDLKSGFMEKRLQDLLLAPPLGDAAAKDPSVKTTHADLFSSDHFDLYVALKWSSLVTLRGVHSFLQASADIGAASSSNGSPFLIPSFVRVSYVSEENSKVAKWRMHGVFFHPAAWEICKDSFDMTWIPSSLSNGVCDSGHWATKECGQWWVYFTEVQMPTSPEVFASEVSPPPVQGGSNFFWMMTEMQRRQVVQGLLCRHGKESECPDFPQAVIPLGDLESFLINFTPNTALGRHHIEGRRPGYSNEAERQQDRQRVKERKQLNDQEDIEKALFDYTIYPAALFHKDATLKAARSRDAALTTGANGGVGPQTIQSSYYDVTITKPRPPVLGWCQAIARRGLCTLYADYFRSGVDERCHEACGFHKDWTRIATDE